jgi:hypothetical protein
VRYRTEMIMSSGKTAVRDLTETELVQFLALYQEHQGGVVRFPADGAGRFSVVNLERLDYINVTPHSEPGEAPATAWRKNE